MICDSMRTSKNILYHTFIGLPVEITNSSSRNLMGKKGTVIDETKNLFIIETAKGNELKIQKKACTFLFHLDDKTDYAIVGSTICFRPEERAKKLL